MAKKENHPQIDYSTQMSTAPAWDKQTTNLVKVGFFIALLALAVVFWSVIPLALTTAVVAYLLTPLTDFFDKRITFGRRGWAVLLTFLLIVIVVIGVVVILIPPLVEQSINGVVSVYDTLVTLIREPIVFENDAPLIRNEETGDPISIATYITGLLEQQGFENVSDWVIATAQSLRFDRETIQQIFNVSGGVTTTLVGSVFSLAGSTLGFLFSGLFFVTILATLLSSGKKIAQNIIGNAPTGYEQDATRLLIDLGEVWEAYVRGNFTLGLIMGAAMWLFAILLGLPNPLFLAFIAFSMEFIPNVGPAITMVIAAIIAIAGGSTVFPELSNLWVAGIVVVVWVVMQQIEAIVLVPRIVGESLKLHPAVVILAVIWGGSFGGIIGVIIAPPLVASFRILLQYVYGRLNQREAFGEQPDEIDNIFSRIGRLFTPSDTSPNNDDGDTDDVADATGTKTPEDVKDV